MSTKLCNCPPNCDETRTDSRGDCDGNIGEYVQVGTAFGLPRGATVRLCGSHARQAGARKEAVTAATADARAKVEG